MSDKGSAPKFTIDLSEETQKTILKRCGELHATLQPLNEGTRGPLTGGGGMGLDGRTTKLPFVFLLGNHSSGKSSFINYVLQRKIQTAGVAPTDDSFTIISPGPQDIDQDGPALVGDPDMGFSGLRHFGPALIHHIQLKVRSGVATNSFMMVDSPGMIDSPVSRVSAFESATASYEGGYDTDRQRQFDRGYDFEAAVRWFADRADVVLLFFDPDKPGTTGETLSILTNSLAGLDHKLYIILNKADQFRRIHDFARAYGSLCWNLSKVITRKDLPRIFTMCLPEQDRLADGGPTARLDLDAGANGESGGLQDLHETRNDVVAEVFKAPKRRIDNVITRLTDSAHLLEVHCTVLQQLQKSRNRHVWRGRLALTGATLVAAGAAAAAATLTMPTEVLAATGAAGLMVVGGTHLYNRRVLADETAQLLTSEGLNTAFEACYAPRLAEGDEFVLAVWKRIRDNLKVSLTTAGFEGVDKVRAGQLQELARVLEEEVPSLRRLASPHQTQQGAVDGSNEV